MPFHVQLGVQSDVGTALSNSKPLLSTPDMARLCSQLSKWIISFHPQSNTTGKGAYMNPHSANGKVRPREVPQLVQRHKASEQQFQNQKGLPAGAALNIYGDPAL